MAYVINELSREKTQPHEARETWSSERVFLFAVIGGAVGIGNLWRFPYLAGENGGGTFIFIYILCVIIASIPLKMAEVALGKAGRGSPILSFRSITKKEGRSPSWGLIGWSMSLSQILVLSFYAVIGGWSLKYAALSIAQQFQGIDKNGVETLFRAGRYDLLGTSFETFEHNIRAQLGAMLGEGGFDPARDIKAITVNRWSHGYAVGYDYETGALNWFSEPCRNY